MKQQSERYSFVINRRWDMTLRVVDRGTNNNQMNLERKFVGVNRLLEREHAMELVTRGSGETARDVLR